jgi:RimJ/RimL family protein N-acetyltransferase
MLIGTQVCLGPLFQEDARLIFTWRNRVELMHLDGLYRPVSQVQFDEWFNGAGKDASRVVFSIRRQGDLELLGFLQINHIHPVYRSAEIGILIGEAVNRGKGYGQEALRLGVGFCWSELNLQRVSVAIVGANAQALHAYRKVGFEHEGVMRRAIYVAGKFEDLTFMGMLR